MQRLHVDGWRGRFRSRLRPEHPGRPLQELSLPGRDLVGMNVKLLRQFGQRLLTPYGSQGHLRFESRRVVPAWSSAHRFSCSAAILAAVRQKLHLSNLFKNPEPALTLLPLDDCPGLNIYNTESLGDDDNDQASTDPHRTLCARSIRLP